MLGKILAVAKSVFTVAMLPLIAVINIVALIIIFGHYFIADCRLRCMR